MSRASSARTGCLAILWCICACVPVKAGYRSIYMTNHCSMVVSIEASLLLELTPPDSLGHGRGGEFLHCDVDILAPRDSRILVHVQRLGISPVSDHSDRLQLYEGSPSNTRLTPIKGLYGRLDRPLSISDIPGSKVKDYKTSSNKLKVDYLGKPTRATPGFQLIITAVQGQ
ncbi:unnamed protein product [Candidula unifasciata]|uniref:Uncharacterized protein n=1 Tax=Candidula unifasciata TaxID=100452 RepID=A0A8S4A390_9EUPU|nr:unnamed protein product [Candidula unifasciata]